MRGRTTSEVTLARPVPGNGQGRVVIVKTYKDAKSYYVDGKTIVFSRPLGIKRNKIVLPPGYEVVGLTVPSQIRTEKDGRIAISFMHAGTGEAPLILKAVKDAQTGESALPKALMKEKSWESPFVGETESERLSERAYQTGTLFIFCSSRRRMRSACITTIRRGVPASMDMRMLCGREAWRVILRLTFWIPGRS